MRPSLLAQERGSGVFAPIVDRGTVSSFSAESNWKTRRPRPRPLSATPADPSFRERRFRRHPGSTNRVGSDGLGAGALGQLSLWQLRRFWAAGFRLSTSRREPVAAIPATRTTGEMSGATFAEGEPNELATSGLNVATSLAEVETAVVKFELPSDLGNVMQSGTGFVINGRGWIATNHHLVARITKDARVKLIDGARLELAGIVARDPKRDLAIVAMRDPPPQLRAWISVSTGRLGRATRFSRSAIRTMRIFRFRKGSSAACSPRKICSTVRRGTWWRGFAPGRVGLDPARRQNLARQQRRAADG